MSIKELERIMQEEPDQEIVESAIREYFRGE